MKPHAFIALLAGIGAALLFVGASTGPAVLRLPLMALVAMPIALAGLSFNAASAIVAAGVGTLVVLALLPSVSGLMFALVALPTGWLVYLALLHREGEDGTAEWYPVGRIVLAAEIIAASLVAAGLVLIAGEMDAFRAIVRKTVEAVVQQGLLVPPGTPAPTLSEAQLGQLTDLMVVLLPAAGAMLMLGSLLVALWLGARVALAAGTLVRPWPDIAAFTFPTGAPVLLVAALLAAIVLEDKLQLVALAYAGAFYIGYVLLGLAVVHHLTRGLSFRTPLLIAVYVFVIAVNSGATLVLAILGLVETLAPMRRMSEGPPPAAGPVS